MRRSRGHGGPEATRIRTAGATAALALALAAAAPAPALGVEQTPTPSGKELREAYPLDPSGEAGGRAAAPSERSAATPTPARTREAATAAATAQRRDAAARPADDDGSASGGLSPWLVSGLLAALVTAAATAVMAGRRRSGKASSEAPPPQPEPATPLFAAFERPEPPAPAPVSDSSPPADRRPGIRTRREPGARRASRDAPAPAAGAAAGARPRRRAAAGPAEEQSGRPLAFAASRFTPAAGPEPSPEPRADGGGADRPPRAPDPEPGAGSSGTSGRSDAPVPAAQDRGGAEQRDPRPSDPAPGIEPPDPDARWTAAVEWRASAGQPRFAVLATAEGRREATEIATSEPVRWPPAGPDDVAALNAVVAALEQALLGAGWSSLPSGDAWYAKRFAWAPPRASAPEPPAPPAKRLSAVEAPEPFRRRGPAAPARRSPPTRQSLVPQPEPRARAPRPDGPGRPPAASGSVEDPGGRFVRRRPWPEDSERLWRAEIKWDAGYKTSRFTVTMRRPGARRGQIIAASEPFKWMLMAEPSDDGPGYRAAVDALVRALRAAGWERVDAGQDWWAERFVWRHDEPPPDHVDAEPVGNPADTQP